MGQRDAAGEGEVTTRGRKEGNQCRLEGGQLGASVMARVFLEFPWRGGPCNGFSASTTSPARSHRKNRGWEETCFPPLGGAAELPVKSRLHAEEGLPAPALSAVVSGEKEPGSSCFSYNLGEQR